MITDDVLNHCHATDQNLVHLHGLHYPHMPIGEVWIYRLSVCLCVCTVTDFSAEDKACGVKFCTAVRRRPRQEISHFVNFAPHKKPRIGRIGQRVKNDECSSCWLHGVTWGPNIGLRHVMESPTWRVDVGSACVDMEVRPRRRTFTPSTRNNVFCDKRSAMNV